MTKQDQEQQKLEAKQLLTGDGKHWYDVKAGDLLLFVVKRSRTGISKRVKIYKVGNGPQGQQLLTLTRNVAVLMGLAVNDSAQSKAFNDGLLTDMDISELAHYLGVKLFGESVAIENPFRDEYISI